MIFDAPTSGSEIAYEWESNKRELIVLPFVGGRGDGLWMLKRILCCELSHEVVVFAKRCPQFLKYGLNLALLGVQSLRAEFFDPGLKLA